ncbi:hypothetical protein BKA62DRAFT_667328 [Auriculariales sp. MPI-PUGE-AT-0066]|nr:hypothetical protein BKA62DRAFT_667328 [Auriculariales sp. MPI-PUGE-AT-0066]
MLRGQVHDEREPTRRSPRIAKSNEQRAHLLAVERPSKKKYTAAKYIRTFVDIAVDATQGDVGAVVEGEVETGSAPTVDISTNVAVVQLQAQITRLQQTIDDHTERLKEFSEVNLSFTMSLHVHSQFAQGHSQCPVCKETMMRPFTVEIDVLPVCRGKITRRPVAAYGLQEVIRVLLAVQPESVRSFPRWEPAWRRLVAQSAATRQVQDLSRAGDSGRSTGDSETNDSLLAYLTEHFQGRMNLKQDRMRRRDGEQGSRELHTLDLRLAVRRDISLITFIGEVVRDFFAEVVEAISNNDLDLATQDGVAGDLQGLSADRDLDWAGQRQQQ